MLLPLSCKSLLALEAALASCGLWGGGEDGGGDGDGGGKTGSSLDSKPRTASICETLTQSTFRNTRSVSTSKTPFILPKVDRRAGA